MKVREAVKQLAALYVEHGDFELKRHNHCMSYGDEDELVAAIEVDPDGYVRIS